MGASALPQGMPFAAGNVTDSSALGVEPLGVRLFHGNMLDADISTATVLYMNPACLSCSTKRQLLHKVLVESVRLQYILTTSPLPGLEESGEFGVLHTELLSPMIGYEWQVPVTLYRRLTPPLYSLRR